jgi:acetylornithine/succinyldiaminopimelate/putrescine aminotransferase/predicted amino acid dehydrogenase
MTPTLYGTYCRPKLQELLSALKLDQRFVKAKGDYLETDEGAQVLDFVGGFGTTILGHNHPELVKVMCEALENDLAINTQGAVHPEAATLAERLSKLASDEARYLVNFSNSGTESVEAALKHAYKKHFDRVRREYERISRTLENFYVELNSADETYKIPNGKSLNKFRDDLDEYNLGQFESFQNNPHVIAFLGSFHGKTSAALKMTFNKSYREPFEGISAIRPHFINPESPDRVQEIAEEQVCMFYYPVLMGEQVEIRIFRVTRVVAVIMEILQGEGGIRPLPEKTMSYLAENYKRLKIPLIIDEIQTGCGRLGSIFSYHRTPLKSIQPDYITLSKALGGGLCKIGATLIREDIYDQNFSILHTSTFGEDALSAKVASRCIDILSNNSFALCDRVLAMGDYLRRQLEAVKSDFPDLVLDVRGEGLMFGVEFSDLKDCSPFFRATGKQGVLSLLISSYMLTYHQLRVLSPLTTMLKGNPGKKRQSIIRIQPSAYIQEAEIDRLITALREVLSIIHCNNEYVLIYHLIGTPVSETDRKNCRRIPVKWPIIAKKRGIDSRTGFVVHPADIDNLIEYYLPSFQGYSYDVDAIIVWWNLISRFLEPVYCRSDYIRSQGFVIENNIVLVPYLASYFRAENKPRYLNQEIRDKIQDAVTIAKELGDDNIPVSVVGLGAYTSIVTQNGMEINDYEVPVTTGNAYTAALTLQGIFMASLSRGLDIETARVAIIGANGNIGAVLSRILSLYVGELLLVGSSSGSSLMRLKSTRRSCYAEILKTATSPDRHNLKGLATNIMTWLETGSPNASGPREILESLEAKEIDLDDAVKNMGILLETRSDAPRGIIVSTDITAIKEYDIVAIATNSPDSELVRPDMVKEGAIVCCASMPSNISPQFDSKQATYCAFDGGLARLPEDSDIDFVGLPKNQLAYGCLSETLLVGFDGQNHSFSKGPLDTEQVYKAIKLAQAYGFELGKLTLHHHALPETSLSGRERND